VHRFLDRALQPIGPVETTKPELRLSARNQLHGTVVSVRRDEVMASVKATIGGGQTLTATVSREAVDDLDLATGDAVVMIVKATEVIVAK
jgi:molybdate transport system regulatory protein